MSPSAVSVARRGLRSHGRRYCRFYTPRRSISSSNIAGVSANPELSELLRRLKARSTVNKSAATAPLSPLHNEFPDGHKPLRLRTSGDQTLPAFRSKTSPKSHKPSSLGIRSAGEDASQSLGYFLGHLPRADNRKRSSKSGSWKSSFSGYPMGIGNSYISPEFTSFEIKPSREQDGHRGQRIVGIVQNLKYVQDDPKHEGALRAYSMISRSGHSTATIPQLWLRDHCQCEACIHPATKQRLIDTFKLSESAAEIENATIKDDFLTVNWRDGHESKYTIAWLKRAFNYRKTSADRQGVVLPVWWNKANVKSAPPEVKYDDVMNTESGVADYTRKIAEIGFCIVDGCPVSPEATKELLERIGPIRTTHYGGFWDFTSNLASKDMAYTDLALDPHTDTTYFTEPAGLQMFHLLEHDGMGGETQLVDGFEAALRLYRQDQDLYEKLSQCKVGAQQ